MSVARPVALQTLGVLPKDPLALQTLGVLSFQQSATQATSAGAQSRGGGGGGLPRWRWPENQPTALVRLDPEKMAGEAFTQTDAERIALAIGRLSRRKPEKE